MPITLASIEERVIFREWKKEVHNHNRYLVKNSYFKQRRMDEWEQELKNIDTQYRNLLKEASKERMEKEKENIKLVREQEVYDEALLEQKRKHLRQRRAQLVEDRSHAPVRRSTRIRELNDGTTARRKRNSVTA